MGVLCLQAPGIAGPGGSAECWVGLLWEASMTAQMWVSLGLLVFSILIIMGINCREKRERRHRKDRENG